MFTASLITELARLNSPPTPDIEGKSVGVLKHRLFDAIAVARGGGAIYETSSTNLKAGIEELINKTRTKAISGFFLDKYTYMHAKKHHNFIHSDSVNTRIHFTGEGMAYGLLLKDLEDESFFRDFVDHNRDIFETCKRLEMNIVNDDSNSEDVYLFSPDGAYFKPMLIGTTGAVIGVFVLGVIFEIIRAQCSSRSSKKKKRKGKEKDMSLLSK